MKKNKIIMDIVLAVMLGLCMAYTFTGGFIHEVIGMIMLIGMLVHMFRRCAYYSSARKAKKNKKISGKFKLLYSTNVVMIYATVIMLFSSVLISRELFSFADFSWVPIGGSMLRVIHVGCSIILLVCVFIHVCLHSKMFLGMVKKAAKSNAAVISWKIFSKVVAVALAALIVKASYDTAASTAEIVAADLKRQQLLAQAEEQTKVALVAEENETTEIHPPKETEKETEKQTETTVVETVVLIPVTEMATTIQPEELVDNNDENSSEEYNEEYYNDYYEEDYSDDYYYEDYYYEEEYVEPDYYEPSVPTLSEYLSWFTCSGCGRHCSLLYPSCGRGEVQASNATEEYYATYG